MSKKILSYSIIIIFLFLSIIFSMMTGSIKINFFELITGLFTETNNNINVIKDLRFPRIIISIIAGAALSVSGVLFQAVLKNPLAEPGIIGVASGASFMTMIMLALFPTLFFYTPLFAFIGGALAFLIVYLFSWQSNLDPLRMILIGVSVNAIFTSLSQTLNYYGSMSSGLVTEITTSTLSLKKWVDVEVISTYGTIGLVLAFLVYSWCNYMSLEDKTAQNLGLNVTMIRIIISAIAVLLASVATAIAGVFVFVGLIVPHIGRILVGSDHKVLIPFSALLGALLVLLSDTIGRTIFLGIEIPASIIMSLIGGPFLIFLIRKSERIYGN